MEKLAKSIDIRTNDSFRFFKNDVFGKVRTVTIENEPFFVARDVATALGYANPNAAIKDHIDERDKIIQSFHDGTQCRLMTIMNESGLYSMIIGSKMQNARDFQHWITAEVLPEIRRTGNYSGENKKYLNKIVPKRNNNYRANYVDMNSLEKIINTVVEAISKIKINVDVNVNYPEPKVIEAPNDNVNYKALEKKFDDFIARYDKERAKFAEKKEEVNESQNTGSGLRYYSPAYIAEQLALYTTTNNPHSRLIMAVASLIKIKIISRRAYRDELVKIVYQEDTGDHSISFSDKAVDMIIDKLNEIWDECYFEERYRYARGNHLPNDIKDRYILIKRMKYHLRKSCATNSKINAS